MTDEQKTTLWELLHESYSISQVIAHSSSFLQGGKEDQACVSSYATLLERSSKLLMQAIAIVDNLKTPGVDHL